MHKLILLLEQIFRLLSTNFNGYFVDVFDVFGNALTTTEDQGSSGSWDRSECLGKLLVKLQFKSFHRIFFTSRTEGNFLFEKMDASGDYDACYALPALRAGKMLSASM